MKIIMKTLKIRALLLTQLTNTRFKLRLKSELFLPVIPRAYDIIINYFIKMTDYILYYY